MTKAWNKPTYTYDANTTLALLVKKFLDVNENDRERLARELVSSTDQVDRWLSNEMTNGLTSKLKAHFEQITGIELDRLYVILAKHNILLNLEHIEKLRKERPSYAKLLSLALDTCEMRFDTLATREEICQALKKLCSRCGAPLIALQLGVPHRQLAKWIDGVVVRNVVSLDTDEKIQENNPSGEYLERCILGLISNIYVSDPDNTRFLVTADALLGSHFLSAHNLHSLNDVIRYLLDDDEKKKPLVIVSRETGLSTSVARKLMSYQPTGRTTWETMVNILRVLLSKLGYLEQTLQAFDELVMEFNNNVKAGEIRISPLRLVIEIEPADKTSTTLDSSGSIGPSSVPTQRQIVDIDDELIPETPPPSLPAPIPLVQVDPSAVLDQQVRAFAAALSQQRAALDAQLVALQLQFPHLLPDSLVLTPQTRPVAPTEQPIQPVSDYESIIDSLIRSKNLVWTSRQIYDTKQTFEHILQLTERLGRLTEEQRLEILSALDPFLIRLHQSIKAIADANPSEFLEMIRRSQVTGNKVRG